MRDRWVPVEPYDHDEWARFEHDRRVDQAFFVVTVVMTGLAGLAALFGVAVTFSVLMGWL